MQKARSHPRTARRPPQGSHRSQAHGFRFCFTRLPAFFSPFPHGTRPLSVAGSYLALEGGPPSFDQGSPNPGLLGYRHHPHPEASPTGLSPPPAGRSRPLRLTPRCRRDHSPHRPLNPEGPKTPGLGSSPFARRYLGNLLLISPPPGTEMFQFPGLASLPYRFRQG